MKGKVMTFDEFCDLIPVWVIDQHWFTSKADSEAYFDYLTTGLEKNSFSVGVCFDLNTLKIVADFGR